MSSRGSRGSYQKPDYFTRCTLSWTLKLNLKTGQSFAKFCNFLSIFCYHYTLKHSLRPPSPATPLHTLSALWRDKSFNFFIGCAFWLLFCRRPVAYVGLPAPAHHPPGSDSSFSVWVSCWHKSFPFLDDAWRGAANFFVCCSVSRFYSGLISTNLLRLQITNWLYVQQMC